MKRRQLLALLGAACAVRPLAARAQQALPTVGFLSTGAPDIAARYLNAWRRALGDTGFVEGRNVAVEYRWAEGKYERAPALAIDLVGRKVAVINTTSGPAALAAKAATTTIPIVFSGLDDPQALGLVESLSRPGGNLTGVALSFDSLAEKRLQLLHELVPTAARIGFLINPENGNAARLKANIAAAAAALGLDVITLTASKPEELEPAFAARRERGIDAILVGEDAFFNVARQRLMELAARHALPVMYFLRHFAVEGGLISYSTSFDDMAYQAGVYVGRILKGARPADLPVVQPTKFELVINLKTAQALGLTVPQSILARADEVIE